MKQLRVTVSGKTYTVTVEELAEGAGTPLAPLPPSALEAPDPSPSGQDGVAVPSPLAGKVIAIEVEAGQQVGQGDPLLVLEAMKMNTQVFAPRPGRVGSIHVQPGDAVEEGQELMMLS